MDWNNVAIILIWIWITRWILGAGYGLYLLNKSGEINDWRDTTLVGPLFWIGWLVGTSIRRLIRWQRSKRTQ